MACVSCGGAQTGVVEPERSGPTQRSGATIQDAVQRCHVDPRDDYSYVAEYRCPDGSVPLGGDPRAGAAARQGNVGPGPDGHIVDQYVVPCPTGPVRIFVDAYHCAPGVDVGDDIDANNLTPEQLASFAQMIRVMEVDFSHPNYEQLRRELIQWVMESPQIDVFVCAELLAGVFGTDHPIAIYVNTQLLLSLAAATIEAGDQPVDPAAISLSGLLGVLRYYEAFLADHGRENAHPRLDELVEMREAGTLPAFVATTLSTCAPAERPGDGNAPVHH